MHQALQIPEILLNIIGHCSAPTRSRNLNPDLAVLARTCQSFKDPALDILWEGLYDLSPLVRCLPEVCCLVDPLENTVWCDVCGSFIAISLSRSSLQQPYYKFSRPLNERERNTLRGYSCRVRFIRGFYGYPIRETIREIFSLAPSLFPHLRTLYWNDAMEISPLHFAVPSLTSLHYTLHSLPILITQSLDAFGDRCPYMASFEADTYFSDLDTGISRVICRWPNLQEVVCPNVVLNTDTILHLSSLSNLKQLRFMPEITVIQAISHLNLKLVFSSLKFLEIRYKDLDTITSFLRYIQLPAIKTLRVTGVKHISRRDMQAYWSAVQEACPSDVLTRLELCWHVNRRKWPATAPLDSEELPQFLTLEDLHPCTAFSELRALRVDINRSVHLLDDDLLRLVSPRMEHFLINYNRGWRIDADSGGITLGGLVQLLQQRPKLSNLCLAIDTRTFTEIPEGLDISFPARNRLKINILDSYILPEFVPGLVSVFTTLAWGRSILMLWRTGTRHIHRDTLWQSVLDKLESAS